MTFIHFDLLVLGISSTTRTAKIIKNILNFKKCFCIFIINSVNELSNIGNYSLLHSSNYYFTVW